MADSLSLRAWPSGGPSVTERVTSFRRVTPPPIRFGAGAEHALASRLAVSRPHVHCHRPRVGAIHAE
ncbi:hypothetical protein GCM10011399_14470 [Subtercola lobariae]|uniref:Uncharacterized protein n=1 Tax=Subtercola lobariae TaxID=1588641 RepID=A0A917B6S8_9MICO|nr:hypothetical protein GCM10011399_14470 [Subtercola lobariae]